VATSGEAAKRRLASQIFDIVVSDICMPDMDGVDSCGTARKFPPQPLSFWSRECHDRHGDWTPSISEPIATSSRATVSSMSFVLQSSNVPNTLLLRKRAGYLRRELRRLTGLDHIIWHQLEDARHL